MSELPTPPSTSDESASNVAQNAAQQAAGAAPQAPSVPTAPNVPTPPNPDAALNNAGQAAAQAATQAATAEALSQAGVDAADIAKAQQAAAQAQQAAQAAQALQQGNLPAAPAIPSAPAIPGAPSLPSAPAVPGAPSLPSAPSVPGAPTPPSAPAVPGAPAAPAAPTPPAAPPAPPSAAAPGAPPEAAPPTARRAPVQATAEELARYSNNLGATAAQAVEAGTSVTNRVEYYFSCVGDEASAWRLRRYSHVEAISELFEVVVELWIDLGEGDPDAMLGTSAEVTITRDLSTRKVQGIVWRYEELQGTQRARSIRVWIVPAAFALTQRIDSRIFQEMNVVDICREVISAALGEYTREVEFRTSRTFAVREYCVQYRESDYDFISRLFESEGLFFWFESSESGSEIMIVAERNTSSDRIESANGGELAVRSVGSAAQHDEVVDDFARRESREITETVAGEFDWLVPTRRPKETSGGTDPNSRKRQAYRPKPSATVRTVGQMGVRDLADQARLLQEEQSAKKTRARGTSNAIGMISGRTVSVVENAEPTMDGEYLIVRVEHHGAGIGPAEDGAGGSGGEEYRNHFWVLPKDLPFRAPRETPKPRHFGPMTATVVGPSGAEIYTDEHGRIKVQFHWDRLGHDDERSSCFMRVTQPWAGPGWGVLFIPRIGMECVVSFLYDDIDQPLITGTVYNAANPPPFGMPDDATRSGWVTRSTPNGEGYNELSFEDKKGSEEVRLQAEKDFNELVKNNHSTTVRANQTNAVSCEQSISVGGNRSVSVKKNETYTIDIDRTTHIKGKETHTVDKNRETTITGEEIETIQKKMTGTYNLGRVRTVNGANDELTVNGMDKLTTVHGHYVNTVDTQYKVAQGSHTQLNLEDKILAQTNGRAQFRSQNSHLDLNNDKANLNATSEISLTCGSSSIVLKSDGTITISGAMKVEIGSGASSAKLEPAGVNIGGPKISSAAIGIHEVTGAVVKIN